MVELLTVLTHTELKVLYVTFCYDYIANVSINSCLLTSLKEILQVHHQDSFLYLPRIVPSSGRQHQYKLLFGFYFYPLFCWSLHANQPSVIPLAAVSRCSVQSALSPTWEDEESFLSLLPPLTHFSWFQSRKLFCSN